jgi:hypothetical protein
MKMKMKICFGILFLTLFIGMFMGYSACRMQIWEQGSILVKMDTVVVRDTVKITVPFPERVVNIRRDTVFVSVNDTVRIPVFLPIEQKTFATADFKATIEGYKPELVHIELFPETKVITRTERKRQRFGIGLHAGYGFNGQHFTPYVGVGVHYNLFSR